MATNDPGTEKYWFNGLPEEGLNIIANKAGTQKYWFNGLPAEDLFPASTTPIPTDWMQPISQPTNHYKEDIVII